MFSKNLDYAGVVPMLEEKTSLQRVILKCYTGVEEPIRYYLKLKLNIPLSQTCVLGHVNCKPSVRIYPPVRIYPD